MTITQKDIEAILGECVGEDTPNSSAELLGFKAYLRGTIPETTRKVLGMVREHLKGMYKVNSAEEHERRRDHATKGGYEIALDDIIASLAGEDDGDNGNTQ